MQSLKLILVIGLIFLVVMPGLVDAQSVSGHITHVSWLGSKSSCGYSDPTTIEIENTGSEAHEFWVLVEVQDPTGKWREGSKKFTHT